MIVSSCRSCGAAVVWAVTEKGARMPVDVQLVPYKGNILLRDEAGQTPVAHFVTKAERADLKAAHERSVEGYRPFALFSSHFATCPQGKGWRRG